MKSTYKYIYLLILSLTMSCQDPFELTRNDVITEDVVFEDETLANAFLADLYERSLFQLEGGFADNDVNLINSFGGEARNFAPWQGPFGSVIGPVFNEQGAGSLNYWPYNLIRETNVFIESLSSSTSLSEDFISVRTSEARFLRAWAYFEMVKRYGGVPLVTIALPSNASNEELLVPRNSEKEIYDFIGSEMDEIAAILPSQPIELGRVSRWVALALKSRAMLYAASVANFGSQQLNGLLGFPASEASSYYQRSLDASNEILTSGPFALYNKLPDDKVRNFIDLFVDENGNPEVIFAEHFDANAGKGHNWDRFAHPDGFGYEWNSNFPVYLETLELFDFVDGRSGKIDRTLYDGVNLFDPEDYFGNRDPRMRASISYPGMPLRGKLTFYHHSTTFTNPETGLRETSESPTFVIPGSDGWLAKAPARNIDAGGNPTSLQIRKRMDESLPEPGPGELSSTDYIIFRLGEIYLNYVEAAFYLADPNGDMQARVNALRDRAGMPALAVVEITEDKIRQERRVELAFESQVFWDLRRWRIAVEELDLVIRHRMRFDYDFDAGQYTIQISDGDKGRVRSHPERNYYYALGLERIADNPNLVENPGY